MQYITTQKEGHLFWIGLNRPKERNKANVEMVLELSEAYTQMESDPEIRCGIVFAHGKHFTVGLELDKVLPRLKAEGRWPIPAGNVNPWGGTGRPRNTPVIVAVQGFCFTLGIELIMASEISLATPNARFCQAEVKYGIFPLGGGTIRWPQIAGRGNGMRYLLTAEPFDAKEAYRLNIIQEIVDKDKLLERAREFGEMIAANSPLGVQATMENFRISEEQGLDAAVQALEPKLQELLETRDLEEGLKAFTESRAPVYVGK